MKCTPRSSWNLSSLSYTWWRTPLTHTLDASVSKMKKLEKSPSLRTLEQSSNNSCKGQSIVASLFLVPFTSSLYPWVVGWTEPPPLRKDAQGTGLVLEKGALGQLKYQTCLFQPASFSTNLSRFFYILLSVKCCNLDISGECAIANPLGQFCIVLKELGALLNQMACLCIQTTNIWLWRLFCVCQAHQDLSANNHFEGTG